MSRPRPTNHAASAYAKLKNIAHEHNMNFMSLLIRYATERFLYRLSIADAAGQFVLKGGNLFVIWQKGQTCRPTVDADLLCFGNAEPGHLREVFLHAASAQASINDGMRFDTNSIRVSAIREESEYGGTRITLNGFLTAAKIPPAVRYWCRRRHYATACAGRISRAAGRFGPSAEGLSDGHSHC